MKFAYLSGCVMAVALVVSSSTPSYARGGGHGGGHGGHGGHAHAHAHHAGHAHTFAHHTGFAGHHFAANHNFAHSRAGWNHGWGHGFGWGYGWGRGWWGGGWSQPGYWGTRYVGSSWPGYLAAGLVNPTYYCQYLNGPATNVPTPSVTTQYDVPNVVQPVNSSTVPVSTPSGQTDDPSNSETASEGSAASVSK